MNNDGLNNQLNGMGPDPNNIPNPNMPNSNMPNSNMLNQNVPNSGMDMNSQMGPNPQMNQNFNPNFQQNPAMNYPQNIPADPNAIGSSTKKNNKALLIGGVLVACVIAIVVVVLIMVLGGGGDNIASVEAKKTLTCKKHTEAVGVVADDSYVFKIDDGTVKGMVYTLELDLARSNFDFSGGSEEDWAKQRIDNDKAGCTDGCTFKSDYAKGKYLKEILSYDEQGATQWAGAGVYKYTAEEIVEKLTDILEDFDAGMGYNCSQN